MFYWQESEEVDREDEYKLKTTLDYPEDYEFLKCIFDELYTLNKVFSLSNIIKLIKDKPELISINRHCLTL